MTVLPKALQGLHSIGEVNAEEDAVLQYFLATDATSKVAQNRVYLVLGRKGAGKTALVRHFTRDYIVGRTHDRPRDIIAYINLVLERKKPDLLISNGDVSSVRAAYSSYFKGELEDEVKAHWPKWEEAIRAVGDIGYLTFEKMAFKEKYEARRSDDNSISDYERALEILYNYSVIAYLRPRPSGGTDWIWKYKQPDQNFDSKAERFKVHLGLQEFANLRSERRVRHRVSTT